MINARMRDYDYYLLGGDNGYGQLTLIRDEEGNPLKQGIVKLSVATLNKTVIDNIRYSDAAYIALSPDRDIKDTYIIQYGAELLKVQYVNPDGRYTQVYLSIYE